MPEEKNILSKLEITLANLSDFGPEIFLASLFLFLIVADLFYRKKFPALLSYITLGGLAFALVLTLEQFNTIRWNSMEGVFRNQFLFSGFLHLNQFEVALKLFFITSALLTVWFVTVSTWGRNNERIRGEFYSILIALLLGLHLMVMSANLLMVYLSLEVVSICSYILTTFAFTKKSAEAGLKYVLFGAFSSGLMLYGISLLYGFTGSLQFLDSNYIGVLENVDKFVLYAACLLTLSGFLFKISASPFHVWAPDVYEGGPSPVIAFFSIAPKAAGVIVLLNFTYPFYQNPLNRQAAIDWQLLLGIITIITLAIGNLAALAQNNAKRLLAYSSIAQAGFILTGLISFSPLGMRSIFFYLCIYLLMNFAAFAMVDIMSDKTGSEDVRKFKGLGVKIPFIGIIFVITLVALTGLPPTAGFNAKLFVFSALWEAYQASGNTMLLTVFIFGLLNTVLALFYYLKIPYYMFFKMPEKEVDTTIPFQSKVFLLLLTVPLVVFFFKPDWLMNFIEKIILNF